MSDRIQSWASLLLGAAVVVLVGWLTVEQMGRTRLHAERLADAGESAGTPSDAGSTAATAGSASADGGTASGGPATSASASEGLGDGGFSLTGLTAFLDAGAVMPTGAPRSVRLGVVLVQWAGAEGAPSSARAKPDALKRALELAEQAKGDWKAAVKAGDSGSSEDIGRIPRGVLDKTTELAVFSLDKDGISEPLETPRGYWVVKRVE